jgi:predicted enzyme related to lactoylglutathione lyase
MSSCDRYRHWDMDYTEVFGGLAVADYPAALAWYERLFGRPADLVPNWNEAAWQLTESGWVYVVGDSTRAGKGLLTLLVEDLDDRIAEFAERGLAPLRIDTLPNLVRKATITDPEGNQITLGQPLRQTGTSGV